jgi:hypothetical protein
MVLYFYLQRFFILFFNVYVKKCLKCKVKFEHIIISIYFTMLLLAYQWHLSLVVVFHIDTIHEP